MKIDGKNIIVGTSADDLLSSLRCSIERITVKDFEDNIEYEKNHQNRKTVLKLLSRAIRYKKQVVTTNLLEA